MEKNSNLEEIKDGLLEIKFLNPDTVLSQIEVQPGMKIADFGCGAGYFTLPLARKVGEEGAVYALDVLPQNLETIASRAKAEGITNIITKRVNLEKESGSTLESESVDWVIMKDMLFQNKDKNSILAEASRVLKKGGRVLFVEWKTEKTTVGPEMSLRISPDSLAEITQKNSLSIFKKINAGDFHYGLIFLK